MQVKNKIILVTILIFIANNFICSNQLQNEGFDNYIENLTLSYDSIIYQKNNVKFNTVNVINCYSNKLLNETKYDSLQLSFNKNYIFVQASNYDLIIDDSIRIFVNNANNSILISRLQDKKLLIYQYLNITSFDAKHIKNLLRDNEKTVVELISQSATKIPLQKDKTINYINNNNLIDSIIYDYKTIDSHLTLKQFFYYSNSPSNKNYQNAFDFISENNKLKKKYENYKILRK